MSINFNSIYEKNENVKARKQAFPSREFYDQEKFACLYQSKCFSKFCNIYLRATIF